MTIDLVPVGNPSNPGEIQGGIFGHVTTSYRIGKTEVTNAQYAGVSQRQGRDRSLRPLQLEHGLVLAGWHHAQRRRREATRMPSRPNVPLVGPGGTDYTYGDKPVVYVSWYDAIRFANWMHNGQGTGNTETGAYTILGGTPTPTNPDSIVRNGGAQWFVPIGRRMVQGGLLQRQRQRVLRLSDKHGCRTEQQPAVGRHGQFGELLWRGLLRRANSSYPMTSVGAYLQSDSPYGTFDQGGNVAEWNETLASAGRRVPARRVVAAGR